MEFVHTFLLESPCRLPREVWWALLWEWVIAPERWREGVTASALIACDEGRCQARRRIWAGRHSFEEKVTWQPGVWLRFVTAPVADFPGGTLTVALEARQGWYLTFTYERQGEDVQLPDGSWVSRYLAAAYRAADEAYVARLRERAAQEVPIGSAPEGKGCAL